MATLDIRRASSAREPIGGVDEGSRGARAVANGVPGRRIEVAARQAVENDVHIIGASIRAAGRKATGPQPGEAPKSEGGEDILVTCGGVIPPHDYDFPTRCGVAAGDGPGTDIPYTAAEVLCATGGRCPAA